MEEVKEGKMNLRAFSRIHEKNGSLETATIPPNTENETTDPCICADSAGRISIMQLGILSVSILICMEWT